MSNIKSKVIVVGAGASGLIAAGHAAEKGFEVTLLEKNDIIGKKILITGKGRCNITSNVEINELIENIPRNGNFLYSAFYRFSNFDIMNFFKAQGLALKVERGERVFPVSDEAKDVVKVLREYNRKNKVNILFNKRVTEIIVQNDKIIGVKVNNKDFFAGDKLIIATGGASYPGTGSNGDGYNLLARIGHNINKIKPSLIPLIIKENWVKELQGLSLKNVAILLKNRKNKKVYSDFGEMIFTHFGVSGPIILSASSHLVDCNFQDIDLYIDLKPALDYKKLEERVIRDFEKYSRKQFKNALDDLLPKKMIPVIIKLADIPGDKFVNQITKKERQNLVSLLKGIKMEIIGSRPINEAIITSGGVCIDEVDSSTMESKIIKNLYITGEVLDLDGYTGGFNLTIAFSTGFLAAESL